MVSTSYFEALLDLGSRGFFLAVAFHEALVADAHQVFLARAAVGRVELRVFLRAGGVELEFDVAALGDLQGGVAGTGDLGEERAHFLGGLEIDFRRVAHPVLVDEQLAGADADHHVVRLVVVAVEEMHVVGGHRLEAELARRA